MVENKKVEDAPKAGAAADVKTAPGNPPPIPKDSAKEGGVAAKVKAASTGGVDEKPSETDTNPSRVPADSPGEQVKAPSADEVKRGTEIRPGSAPKKGEKSADELIEETVKRTQESVDKYNETAKIVASDKPPEKKDPELEKAPTKEENIEAAVERTAQSVEEYNRSAEIIAKAEPTAAAGTDKDRDLKPDVKRVAPLTGELREDSEDDSYVTPGQKLLPPGPAPGEPAPEFAPEPIVIAPITGELRPADLVSYPTPGRMRDPERVNKAVEVKDIHNMGKSQSPFGVPLGHQVGLFEANKEMFRNKREQKADRQAMFEEAAAVLAQGGDGLRRTRRVQKNLR